MEKEAYVRESKLIQKELCSIGLIFILPVMLMGENLKSTIGPSLRKSRT